MNKLPEKDFIHTEAFEWVNRTKKVIKEDSNITIVIDQKIGLFGYVILGCLIAMSLITVIMGSVATFGFIFG